MAEIALQTENLSIGYAGKRKEPIVVAKELNLELYKGCLTTLLGLNGSGKSTLLRTLCGFLKPLGGAITIEGRPAESYSRSEFALTVGIVLTDKTNAGGITARELVSLGRHPHTGFWGKLGEEDEAIVQESLEAVHIDHKAEKYYAELSDGEKQKVVIAKALAQACPIIILDEPTAFLDVKSRAETMELLHELAQEKGKSILLSTHDLDLAVRKSDRIWVLDHRLPTQKGTPRELSEGNIFQNYFGVDR